MCVIVNGSQKGSHFFHLILDTRNAGQLSCLYRFESHFRGQEARTIQGGNG